MTNSTRNKDIGKPGNGGQWASRTNRAPEIDLTATPDYSTMTTHLEVEEAFVARYVAASGQYNFIELLDAVEAHSRLAGDERPPLTFSTALSLFENLMSPENIAADGERSRAQARAYVARVRTQFAEQIKAIAADGHYPVPPLSVVRASGR